MIKDLLYAIHPDFDVISALADRDELSAARSRAARHVAHCAECRAVLEEIRAMGDSARNVAPAPMSPRLWDRIQAAASPSEKEETAKPRDLPSPDRSPWEVAPSLRPTRHWPIPTRRSLGRIVGAIAVAAVALLAVTLATGRTRVLIAGAPSRFVAVPANPAPGARVHLRYTAPPKLAQFDKLVLLGQFLKTTRQQQSDYYFGGRYDSLTTLRKAADGSVVGDFVVPADFQAASIVVVDPSGRIADTDRLSTWLLIGGDGKGHPALNALLAAISMDALYGSPARAAALDTLQKYYPEQPAGFATAKHYREVGVFADLLRFFQSAERKYASFDERLSKLPRLDAGRTTAMIDFAYAIEEPGEAAKWTRRLVHEHPSDPSALTYYGRMLHAVELKEPPADSIRPLLPLLDTLYEVSPHVRFNRWSDGYVAVMRYGDEATKRRWMLRAAKDVGLSPYGVDVGGKWLEDPEIRSVVEGSLRRALATPCEPTGWAAGRFTRRHVEDDCKRLRGEAFVSLSTIALAEGSPSHSMVLADSAAELYGEGLYCYGGDAQRARSRALLALGDTIAAARAEAFHLVANTSDVHSALSRQFGAKLDTATLSSFEAKARSDLKDCQRASAKRDSAEVTHP